MVLVLVPIQLLQHMQVITKYLVKDSLQNGEKYGKGAGSIRNCQMLNEGNPDLILAFHPDINSSKGTKNMVSQAIKSQIPVMLISGKSDSIKQISEDMLE